MMIILTGLSPSLSFHLLPASLVFGMQTTTLFFLRLTILLFKLRRCCGTVGVAKVVCNVCMLGEDDQDDEKQDTDL